MFSFGEGEGPFLGQGLLLWRLPRFQVAVLGGLPSHIQKVGAKNRAGEGNTLPRLAAFALTTGFTWDTHTVPVRAWDLMAPAVTGFVPAAEEAVRAVCGDPWSCAAHRAQGHRVCVPPPPPTVGLGKSRQAPPGHVLLFVGAASWGLFLLSPAGHHRPSGPRSVPALRVTGSLWRN